MSEAAAAKELAPTGRLRCAINMANPLLTRTDANSGAPAGIVVDLSHELGRRLGVEVDIIPFPSPGELADAVTSNVWDIGFIGAEPQRATHIEFTPAYLEIEATYLVPQGSSIKTVDDVDREGVRIACLARAAYELYLSRNLRHAKLVLEPSFEATFQRFVSDSLDAEAGLRTQLMDDAKRLPGSRVLDGKFSAVQQAIGTPKTRAAGARYLREFVKDIKASGFAARVIQQNGVTGVSVAPAAD